MAKKYFVTRGMAVLLTSTVEGVQWNESMNLDYRPTSFLKHARILSSEDVMNLNLEMMPGFSLKWHYTSTTDVEIKPNRRYYSKSDINVAAKKFETFVQMFKMKNQSEIESAINKVTIKNEYWLQTKALDSPCKNGFYETRDDQTMKLLQDALKINNMQNIYLGNMTDDELRVPAALFLKLVICPPKDLKPWFSFFSYLFQKESAVQIILSLNRILKNKTTMQTRDLKIIASKLFERATTLFSLSYTKLLDTDHMDFYKEGNGKE